ncbi:MAG: MFS transporter [Bacteroidetes bacterium]|uniref:MFS transporter n=1 Tax=Candidatus Cryptobacteroides avistercoris TaxID=2840758 RepID=A0A9D9NNR5_9BACT|nr:MFS transporter [Candidatus Cryptobacteroides avistercoris]
MKNANVSLRLILMNFLEFAVWGAYLTSMGSFLAESGFGPQIWLFFATQGFVSIFMPALMGIIADKWIPAQKVLSLCQGLAGASMLAAGLYAMGAGAEIQFGVFYALYTISVAFFMPTIAIANSVAYNALEKAGKDPVKDFPPIRVFGTVGFICSMLFVNFMRGADGVQFQHTYNQFIVSGALSLVLCIYALSLPNCPCKPKTAEVQSFADSTGLSAFRLFKNGQFAIFFIFSMLLGAALQITNGYANTFITSFVDNPDYANTWGANNANALISLSQISETLCILLIPFFMKRFGIKRVMLIAMFAWVFRFAFFGLGNPGGGVWLFVLSCIVYGMAFDFFNISGSLFVNEHVDKEMRSSAQGLFMLMTNGLGASIGTWAAGIVVNHFVYNAAAPNWSTAWYIFAAYALVVAILFMIVFKDPDKHKKAA